jgi:uncharacterized protein
MKESGESKLLRVFLGESEKHKGVPVYEKIVLSAKEHRLAGATVIRGVMGYGRNSIIHTSKLLALSEDMPIIVEIVDEIEKVEKFIPFLNEIFENSNCAGLITLEKVEVIKYISNK